MERDLVQGNGCRHRIAPERRGQSCSEAGGSMTFCRTDEPRGRVPVRHCTFFLFVLLGSGVLQSGGSPRCDECFCGQACAELQTVDAASLSCIDFQAKLLLRFFPEPGCNNSFFADQKNILEKRCGKEPTERKHQCNFVQGLSQPEEVVSIVAIVISFIFFIKELGFSP